jgi:lysosomal acid lipase/cholesteryl ester hydrolase
MVTTIDGYILTLNRIPGAHREDLIESLKSAQNKTTVLWMSGILGDASTPIFNGIDEPHKAIPYQLADEGYDVWLMGYRGTVGSRTH